MKYKLWMYGGQIDKTFETEGEAEEYHDRIHFKPVQERIEIISSDGSTRFLYDTQRAADDDRDGAYADRITEVE